MVKKLSALVIALFGSILVLCGCGDPYKDLSLTVSTSNIVLYLNEAMDTGSSESGSTESGSEVATASEVDFSLGQSATDAEIESNYPSSTSFVIKLSGAGKDISSDVKITQYAYNGVEDIVKLEQITDDITGDGARYKITALRSGNGVLVINSAEGNKRQEINISVQVPIKGVVFNTNAKAVKYLNSIDLYQFLTYNPSSNNQTDLTFYIDDSTGVECVTDGVGIIETAYAKIENGVVISKESNLYPLDQEGNRYVKVYGISKYNPNIRTQVIDLPVIEVIDEESIVLTSITEDGTVDLTKVMGNYEIILGHNIPSNPYVYARDVIFKLSEEYTIDQKYVISTNYNSSISRASIFELDGDDVVSEESRYEYAGLKENYPYKQLTFSQLSTGSDVLEVYIDRRGYEGLFTITLKIKVTVKDFATELTAVDEDGKSVINKGITLYNAYGGGSLGTNIYLNLSPNPNANYKIRLVFDNVPLVNGVSGVKMTLVNGNDVYSGSLVDGGTRIYLKHIYEYAQITEILESGITPRLVLTYTFTLAPTSNTEGYSEYSISEEIPLTMEAGVTDITVPTGSNAIKINAVTGTAVNSVAAAMLSNNNNSHNSAILDGTDITLGDDPTTGDDTTEDTASEIVLVTIENQPADLAKLIKSVKAISVDGVATNYNLIDGSYVNPYFDIVFKQGLILDQYNRLVIEPKLQANQGKVTVEVKTNNYITKTIVVEIFVPIVYDAANIDAVNVEIHNENTVGSYIYESTKTNYRVIYNTSLSVALESSLSDEELLANPTSYTTISDLTLAVNSRVGLNVYNYVVLNNSKNVPTITRVNYNSNITLSQNREYYTIEYESVNGYQVPFIVTKKLKTTAPIDLEIRVVGYDNNGTEVVVTKIIKLSVIEPVTSISLTPVNSTLYTADSLGALKLDASKLQYALNVYPLNASSYEGTIIKYSFRNDVLYTLTSDNSGKDYNICVEHFLTLNSETGAVQAILDQTKLTEVLTEYRNDSLKSIEQDEIIKSIFENNIVVTVYATLKQYNKPEISTSATITLKNATKVEKIIPSVDTNGVYFDLRKIGSDYAGYEISFNVLPYEANNKTLMVTVGNESVVKITSGVDSNNRIENGKIVIKPGNNAGRTYIRIAAEDSYAVNSNGTVTPTSYLDISIRVADGTKEYPFEIKNAEDFLEIGEDIAAGNNKYYYVLTQTFSLASYEFAPFGEFGGGLSGIFSYEVAGIIYEQQNSLYGLTFNKTITPENGNIYSYGMFKQLTATAEIEGLILSDVNIKLDITNSEFADEINVGTIAGINYGLVNNSSVNGVINVTSNVKNLNIGGLVGKNLSVFDAEFLTDPIDDTIVNISAMVSGVISDDVENVSNFTNGTENANIQINYVGSSSITDSNVNIGGVVGKVQTYAVQMSESEVQYVGSYFGSESLSMTEGVSVYQSIVQPTISNLVVASSIVSIDETGKPYKANVGGVIGYSNSTLIDNVISTTVLRGHSNIGGIVGYAEQSVISNSAVEFANQGQTGENTISISGYTNVGGMVGYAKNVSIMFSYVRAYFNNKAIDNETYYGNIALLESTEATKNIGGLIGYIDAEELSEQLISLGLSGYTLDIFNSDTFDALDYSYNKSANSIIKSYFNADINVGYTTLSGTVNVGGLVGATTEVGKTLDGFEPLNIVNSYFYGNISQPENRTYSFINYQTYDDSQDFYSGTFITYVVGDITSVLASYHDYVIDDILLEGNNLIEVKTTYTNNIITEGEEDSLVEYQIQNIVLTVSPIAGKLIGNQTFYLSDNPDDTITQVIDSTTSDDGTQTTTNQTVSRVIKSRFSTYVRVEKTYFAVGDVKGVVESSCNLGFSAFKVVSTETIVETTYTTQEGKKYDVSNTVSFEYVDLTKKETFESILGNIVVADLANVELYPTNTWLLCSELNNGYPVLFAREHSNGEILFKVLPTEIKINVVDNSLMAFSNLSYVKDSENIVLFYNKLTSGRSYKYINYYKLVTAGETDTSTGPVTALEVNLDIVDLYEKYGIIANYDKNMVITTSNSNIVSVEGNNIIKTNATGRVTLTVSSRLDTSIYDTIEILVVEGLSDFALYKTKNLTTESNKLVTVDSSDIVDENSTSAYSGVITQVIDKVSNYATDSVNEDGKLLTDCNGVYVKNSKLGVMLEVSNIGNGEATLNGVALEKGVTYLHTSLSDFSFKGTYKGLLYVTITPFIITNDVNFGTTLYQTTSNPTSIDNCILIEQLSKTYKFNIVPKAESIEVDKSAVNLDPIKTVELTVTTITSDFVQTGSGYDVNETINVVITDLTTNKNVGAFALDMSNQGNNSSFINIEILEEYTNPTNDVLKVEYVKKLRLSFDTNKYKDRTGGVTFNLKDINYKFEFYPTSNTNIVATFNLQIVPRVTTNIETAYYPNAETSSTGSFYPQESESEYIVPSRVGLLKVELLPDFNNTEYVEITVSDSMKKYVSFVQQLAIMASDENSYVTGYRNTLTQADSLPNFSGVRLRNESVLVNGTNIYYTGNYYVQVFLSEEAPVNSQITFTVTAYKTENGTAVAVKQQLITLTVQPLPSISLTYNGAQEGLIAKGTTAELEVVASNFEGEIQLVSSCLSGDVINISEPTYNQETGKWYVDIGLNANAGDTAIIKATASRYLNGVLEERTSTVKLYIVEYIVNGARLEGSTYVNGGYQFEVLNGTQTPLNVVFDVTKSNENEAVDSLLTNLEQLASGKIKPLGVDSYVNNWWKVVNGVFDNGLFSNATYGNYKFVDTNKADLTSSHYFALESIAVSNNNVIGYRMQYYYNEIGVPTLYVGSSYGYDVYELEFTFTFVIKDNSTYDHPNPISNLSEFMALGGMNADGLANEAGEVTEGHYILVSDLVLTDYHPFEAKFDSLDGNGHIITINSINTEKYKAGTSSNVGLFETVASNTVLKNITINVAPMLVTTQMANSILKGEEGTTAYIDLTGVSTFNFGFVTGQNNGSITNAKVINTQSTKMLDTNSAKHVLIASTIGYLNSQLVEATVGGIAAVNNGTISNSYVGLNASNYTNETSSTENHSNTTAGFSTIVTYPFNITGGKSISGFVNTNSGILANNYVLGVGIINTATIMEGAKTAGFIIENQKEGTIFNSMVEGLQTNNYRADETVYIEGKGYIGGFVYSNAGKISNAYSNIKINTNSGGSGGFVYTNEESGVITNAYSTVSNANNSLAHGQFTGIDDKDGFNNFGTLTSCYYLILEGETENANEPATGIVGKQIIGDGAVSEDDAETNDNPFRDTGSFNGFNFASGNDTNNIWQISQTSLHLGPRLISASAMTTFSHRVLMHTTTDENTQETVYNYMYDSDCFYGSNLNPLLVNTAEEFVKFIINNSKTVTLNGQTIYVFGITAQSNSATNMPYYVRLINDLDFSSITLNNYYVDSKLISQITFAGVLDGNGMQMTGIRLVDQNQSSDHENYGLFYQVGLSPEQVADPNFGSNNTVTSAIMNINMTIKGVDAGRAYKVGAIAGSVYDTALINITLNGAKTEGNGDNGNAFIKGRNIVGGIAGLIQNSQDKLITDIVINNISATASHSSASVSDITKVDAYGKPYNVVGGNNVSINFKSYYNNEAISNLSYAGGFAGIIDNNNRRAEDFGMNIKTSLAADNGESIFLEGSTVKYPLLSGSSDKAGDSITAVEEINKHRTKPANNMVSRITVKNGGYISAEHAGGIFGYVGENTHVKNSKYLLGKITDENESESAVFRQEIVAQNYAGAFVGENYGMLEQVAVEYVDEYKDAVESAFGTGSTVSGEVTELFGTKPVVAIGGIAGFSAGSIILDSYTFADVVNTNAKIAGGLVGLTAGANYFSHVITTGNINAIYRVGGLIGVYDSLYTHFYTMTDSEEAGEDLNGNGITGETSVTVTVTPDSKLLLDYAFALNEWGTESQELLENNLKEYYLNTTTGSDYYTFELRMPEIGNQLMTGQTSLKYETNFIGSLIGYVNVDATKTSITTSGINSVVDKARRTQVVNNGGGSSYLFSTVISTTFNSAKITKNDNIYAYAVGAGATSNTVIADNTDYFEALSNNTGADGSKGDILEFVNTVGSQFKIDVVLGRSGSNATMFNMFIWDTLTQNTTDSSLADAGSQVWRLGDVFPQYIIGIYSNYNTMDSSRAIYDSIINSNDTRNQFYLLANTAVSTDSDGSDAGPNGEYILTNKYARQNTFSNAFKYAFEGSLIGVVAGGKNPKIVLNIESGKQLTTFFNELNTASIMNVDFEVNYTGTTEGILNSSDGMTTQDKYNGFFAKYVNSSVISNVNFTLNINSTSKLVYDDQYEAIGLMIGYLKDSTLQGVNVVINNVEDETTVKNLKLEKDTCASGSELTAVSFGGVVGYASKSKISEVGIYSYNDKKVELTNYDNNIHIGGIVGYSNNSDIKEINVSNIDLINEPVSNAIFELESGKRSCTVNFGGLVGYATNSALTTTYFMGDIEYGYNYTLNSKLNLGGILGYGVNTAIEHANVNEFMQEVNGTSIKRTVIQKTIPNPSTGGTTTINYSIKVKNGISGSNSAITTNVGAIVGYGLNTAIRGSSTNGLNTSTNTDITIEGVPTTISVGGVAGYIKNSESATIAKVVNTGKISVSTTETNSSTSITAGGIVGKAYGGVYTMLYNLGELVVKTENKYSVGGIFGGTETGSSQTILKLSKFVNFADLYYDGNSIPKASSNRFIGGVAGQIIGSGSQFEGGYTLARIYWMKNGSTSDENSQFPINNKDSGGVNGIAYISAISESTFNKVYFVYDFLPYSNYSNSSAQTNGTKTIVTTSDSNTERNYGGVEYVNLVEVLNYQLSSYFSTDTSVREFVTTKTSADSGATEVSALNLPHVFKDSENISATMYSALELIKQTNDVTLPNSARKLNPIKLNTSAETFTIKSNGYYIMSTGSVNGKTVQLESGESFTGLLTCERSENGYPTIKLTNLVNNYGCLSNFAIRYVNNQTYVKEKGVLVQNNYGNISNCVTYGFITGETLTLQNDVATFVYNNYGNILQSGSVVMFALKTLNLTDNTVGKNFSGFVNTNTGFIKDSYSLSSYIDITTDGSGKFNNTANSTTGKVAGFVIENSGVIETCYYAGTLTKTGVTNVFVHTNSISSTNGTLRSCYYDIEATPVTGTASNVSASEVSTISEFTGVKYLRTADMLLEDGTSQVRPFYSNALKTNNVPSAFKTNYTSNDANYLFGYSGIKGGIQIPTMFYITTSRTENGSGGSMTISHTLNTDCAFKSNQNNTSNEIAYGIYHIGQFNNLTEYQDAGEHFFLLTNLDFSKINYAGSSQGSLVKMTTLSVNFYGFGHVLKNVNINSGSANVGLFAEIKSTSTVENFNINTATVQSTQSGSGTLGVVAGLNNGGTINLVTITTATITGGQVGSAGGAVGKNTGTVAHVDVTSATITGQSNLGGIAGTQTGGTIKFCEVSTITIRGTEKNIGGVVGDATPGTNNTVNIVGVKVKGTTTITNSKSVDLSSIRSSKSGKWTSSYDTDIYKPGANELNTGGVVGYLGTNATLAAPYVEQVKVSAIMTAGGLVGNIGASAKLVSSDSSTGYSVSSFTISDATKVIVTGSANLGGVAGRNSGTIQGGSSLTKVYATIGTNRSSDRYDSAIGGIAGSNWGGTIANIEVTSSKVYGSRLIGGLVGYASSGTIKDSRFNSSTIYYQSEYDMDENVGYMGDSLYLGISSSSATWTNNNFDKYFGLGGKGGRNIFDGLSGSADYVIEYGGIETKLGSNTKITGKESFKILLGFYAGANGSATFSSDNASTGSTIAGIYDIYHNYVVDMTGHKDAGQNHSKLNRWIDKYTRIFNIPSSSTQFNIGSESYKKYNNDVFKNYTGSTSLYNYTLSSATAKAAMDKKETLEYLYTTMYNSVYQAYYNYYAYNYNTYGAADYANTNASKTACKKFKEASYPGMTWVSANYTERVKSLGEKTYYGKDEWFAELPSTMWKNVGFENMDHNGNN